MSIMKEFEIKKVEKMLEVNPVIVEKLYELRFGKKFKLSDLDSYEKDDLYSFIKELEIKLAEFNSGINTKYLAKCIQKADTSPFGLRVLTKFTCKKCGKEETYGSSPAPSICSDCALLMAEIIVQDYKIFMNRGE